MAISTPIRLLSVTLWAQGFRLFRRPLWRVVWSNRWGSRFPRSDILHKCGQSAVFCAAAVMRRPGFGKSPWNCFCDGVNNDKRYRKHFDPHHSTVLCPLMYQKFDWKIHDVRSKSIYTILPSKSWEFSRKIESIGKFFKNLFHILYLLAFSLHLFECLIDNQLESMFKVLCRLF